ncbi:MAG TPA: GNAT family N-acetyltransferase [Chloroflexota bacterium]|nr:GNAT family N-acetyltransferase [Chloroflexota bacterium]
MTTSAPAFEITPLADVPERLLGVRQELNQLSYGPSEVLVARVEGAPADQVSGAVRLALRERPARPHGLIADLTVDDDLRELGLPEQLIAASEERLKARGAQKIDAVTVDGKGWAPYYFRRGFWSSRRMVVLTWDLEHRNPVERNVGLRIEQVDSPDPDLVARFALASYQPYFRWWKETAEDQKWDRVELQPEDERPSESANVWHSLEGVRGRGDPFDRAPEAIRLHALDLVTRASADPAHTFFLAYQDGELIGLCDAKDAPEGEDTFDWCVLVSRHFGGKGVGSTLLDHALTWLHSRGRRYAEYTSTSGLDDYDPLIYLSTVATGAQIRGEFLNLVKNRP